MGIFAGNSDFADGRFSVRVSSDGNIAAGGMAHVRQKPADSGAPVFGRGTGISAVYGENMAA